MQLNNESNANKVAHLFLIQLNCVRLTSFYREIMLIAPIKALFLKKM